MTKNKLETLNKGDVIKVLMSNPATNNVHEYVVEITTNDFYKRRFDGYYIPFERYNPKNVLVLSGSFSYANCISFIMYNHDLDCDLGL